MTDRLFHDVVTDVRIKYEGYRTLKPTDQDPDKCQALCGTCGTYHEATGDELGLYPDEEDLRYVGSMRAWDCCHEGEKPYDGLPQVPDNSHINGPENKD